MGYFVRCIRRAAEFRSSPEVSDAQGAHDATEHDHERLILELQPTERGTESQNVEADLVLWTVGSKPLLPELEASDKPIRLPLNGRGQAETDETLRVKGHPRTFAIGDSSAVKDKHGKLLPGTAQVLQNSSFQLRNPRLCLFGTYNLLLYLLSGGISAGRFCRLESVGCDKRQTSTAV